MHSMSQEYILSGWSEFRAVLWLQSRFRFRDLENGSVSGVPAAQPWGHEFGSTAATFLKMVEHGSMHL